MALVLQIPIHLRFPIHPLKGVHWCSKKKLSGFSEESVYECFEKATAPNVSENFLVKHPGWSPF